MDKIEADSLRHEMKRMSSGLQRYMTLTGITLTPLCQAVKEAGEQFRIFAASVPLESAEREIV